MNILIVTILLPYPPNSGVQMRDFNLIKGLSLKGHRVFVISFVYEDVHPDNIKEMEKYCSSIDIVGCKVKSKLSHLPNVLRVLLTGQPLDNAFYFSDALKRKIMLKIRERNYDIIQFEHAYLGVYRSVIPKNYNAKLILDFHNIEFNKLFRIYKNENNFFKKIRLLLNMVPMKRWELAVAEKFDVCATTSEIDFRILKNENPNIAVVVKRNGIDIEYFKQYELDYKSSRILFVGTMGYPPNADAAKYFVNEMFVKLKKIHPELQLYIVGANPPEVVKKLEASPGVIVTGSVSDTRPYYEQSYISIVPLRSGGGTRLKILESMALGRPVVSTSIGCEGLEVENKKNILIADTPKEFCDSITSLIDNQAMAQYIVDNGRKLVEKKYACAKIVEDWISLYKDLIRGRKYENRCGYTSKK